jgi:carbonic anhydrase
LEKLIAGYREFRRQVWPVQRRKFESLAGSQAPQALFVTCSDSRVVPSMITQSEPGALFHCRVVGNLVPAHGTAVGGVTAAVEYAVVVLKVPHIVICGHSDCGAMKAFLKPEALEGMQGVGAWLEHARTAIEVTTATHRGWPEAAFLDALIRENIVSQIHHLRTHPCVAAAERKGDLQVHGWHFDIGSGEVTAYDDRAREFRALDPDDAACSEQRAVA